MSRQRLCFVVESGTDVRMVEGLAERFELRVLARKIDGGVEINWPLALPAEVTIGPASRLGFARLALRHLLDKKRQYDFVIVQSYGLAALAANVAGRLTGTPTAMLICSPIEAYYECRRQNSQSDKQFRWHELALLRALARINGMVGQQYIVLSEYLAQVVRGHGTRKPIRFIPIYGVDTEIFSPLTENRSAVRGRLGLPQQGSLIFFSSRIAPEKDSETLLAAAKMLIDQGRDLWLLHRSGGYRSFIKDAQRFGIGHRVIATDAIHPHRELPQDYQVCDLCVQASRAEGLGFSPLEALACEIPVVATAVGGLRETIVNGRTGWTYPAGDADALANCIAAALDNPDEAASRAVAGRCMVIEKFDRRKCFAEIEQLVRDSKVTKLVTDLTQAKQEWDGL